MIVGQDLENDFVYRMLIKSSYMKISIDAASSISLNHLRSNRLPIF